MAASNGAHATGALVPTTTDIRDVPTPAGHDLLWDGLAPAVTSALAQPIDPAAVSRRKGRGGREFAFISGSAVISEANSVFGFGAWGYEAAEVTLREIESADPRTGEVRTVRAYSARVRVTVPGAPPRTDVGYKTVADESPEGHETAYKGAVTDALKRALRSFGDRFGNGLNGHGRPAPGPSGQGRASASGADGSDGQARMLRRRLVEVAAEQGIDEEGVRTAVRNRTGKDLGELTAAELGPLVKAASDKLRQQASAA